MSAFFQGWRRKVGGVALVIACGLMGLWIRSYVVFDQFLVASNLVISNSGCLVWSWAGWGMSDFNNLNWYSENASPFSEDWYLGTDGVRFPYWAVNVPLSLLSAYLILAKPLKQDGAC